MDTGPLRDAYGVLLDAADTVVGEGGPGPRPPADEWSADEVLAHVAILGAVTIAAVSAVAAGENTTYDNRLAQDSWTIGRVIALAGGSAGLRERIRVQADALCALSGPVLSETELDTRVPTRLVSKGTLLVDQPMPLRDLIAGLAAAELPGHARQLLALRLGAGEILPADDDNQR
jgi:hypothetical protein